MKPALESQRTEAADTQGTAGTSDDTVASFSASSAGCGGCKNPDFLAPGAHLQGLRVPNSWVDANHPEGRIDSVTGFWR